MLNSAAFPGTKFLPSQNPVQVLLEGRQKRLFARRSARKLVGTHEFYVLFANHAGRGRRTSWGLLQHASHAHQRVVMSAHVGDCRSISSRVASACHRDRRDGGQATSGMLS